MIITFTRRAALIIWVVLFVAVGAASGQFYTERGNYINANAHFIANRNSWLWVGITNVNDNPREARLRLGDFENVRGTAVSDPHTGALLFYVNNKMAYNVDDSMLKGGKFLLPYPIDSSLLYLGTGDSPPSKCDNMSNYTDQSEYAPSSEGYRVTGNPVNGVVVVPFQDSTRSPYTKRYLSFNMPGIGHSYANPIFAALFGFEWDWHITDWNKGLPIVYSIIDMNLDDGLGEVEPHNLRIPLIEDNFFGEGMIAIPGEDCDMWLITHHIDSSVHYAWHISEAGVAKTPVRSVFNGAPDQNRSRFRKNKWAVSPDRRKVAHLAMDDSVMIITVDLSGFFGMPPGAVVVPMEFTVKYSRLTLMDFDPAGGVFTKQTHTGRGHIYDIEFSTDGSYLYATGTDWEWADIISTGSYFDFLYDSSNYYKLYQYDVSNVDPFAVYQEKKFPHPYPDFIGIERDYFQRMSKLPDGRLLFNTEEGNNLSIDRLPYNFITLNNINQPLNSNSFDLDQFIPYTLAPYKCITMSDSGLINIMSHGQNPVVYPLYGKTEEASRLLALCYGDTISPQYRAFDNRYEWNDGDSADYKIMTEPGVYWVRYQPNFCITQTDTFVVWEITDLRFDLGKDTVVCAYKEPLALLPLPLPNAYNYLWQDGSDAPLYVAGETGVYIAAVSYKSCVHTDTVFVEVVDLSLDLGEDRLLCMEEPVYFELNTGIEDPAVRFIWQDQSSGSSFTARDTGIYSVVVALSPCYNSDSVRISYEKCECDFSIPNAFTPNGDGRNDHFTPVLEPGCIVEQYRMRIFNRYGQTVFVSESPDQRWDGVVNGMPADLGVYFYEMSYLGGTHRIRYYRKGDITLLR